MNNPEFGTEIQNTRNMRLDPQHAEEFHSMDPLPNGEVRLVLTMTGEVFEKAVPYKVIVEGWERSKRGRNRREYLKLFGHRDRKNITRYYGRFYRWYLVSGTPMRVACSPTTIELLQRAVNFFGSLK